MDKFPFYLLVTWAVALTLGLVTGQLNVGWDFITRIGAQSAVMLLLLYACLHIGIKAFRSWMRYREYSELR